LNTKYGEARVQSAARRLIDGHLEAFYLTKLLDNPNVQLPNLSKQLSVADVAAIRAANGNTVMVSGTIDRIVRDPAVSYSEWYVMYFREVPDGSVRASLIDWRDWEFMSAFKLTRESMAGKKVIIRANYSDFKGNINLKVPDVGQIQLGQ
jgi:hypothetical protein